MPEPKIHDERYIPGSRIARAADRVAEALGKDYPGNYTPSKRDRLCYVRDRRGVASLVVWLPWNGQLFIGTAWTRLDRREQGLYRRIIEHLKGVARTKHLKTLSVGVSPQNVVSIVAHKYLGFVHTISYFDLPLEK